MRVATLRPLIQRLTSLVGLLILSCHFLHVECADPVLTPTEVKDSYGNRADSSSIITWAATPKGGAYNKDEKYNDGGLGPLYNFARSFINTTMSKPPPYDLLRGLIEGTVDITKDYMKLVNYAIGFAVCVVIGFLFLGIFPLVGLCFCCFRCCHGCGGNMKRIKKKTDNIYRVVYTLILSITTIFVFVGVMCVFATNKKVNNSISSLKTLFTNNTDNMGIYINNTVKEIDYISSDTFNFTAKVIFRDLDNIGGLIGIPVRDKLSTEGNASRVINAIIAFDKNITYVGNLLMGINSSIGMLKDQGKLLANALTSAKSDIDAGKGACSTTLCNTLNSSVVNMDIDLNNLPDISAQLAKLEGVRGRNLTALALEGKAQLDDIPDKITNKTKTIVNDIKDLLVKFSGKITDQVSEISSLPSQLAPQLTEFKGKVNEYGGQADQYDKYRWAGGLGLASIGLLVVILQLLGIVLGLFGYNNKMEAHERSNLSHIAGQLLMAASGFIFLFASLLMFLCTLLFLVGGLMEKVVCQPLIDPSHEIFNKLLDGPNGLLKDTISQIGIEDLTIGGVLDNCKANQAAYSALKLDSMFDLATVTDYKKTIDIESQTSAIAVNLSDVKLLSPKTEQQLEDFKTSIDIPFKSFNNVLTTPTLKTDLSQMVTLLNAAAANSTTPRAAQQNFRDASAKLTNINTTILPTFNNIKDRLLTDVKTMELETINIPTGVDSLIKSAKDFETYLDHNGSAVVKAEVSTYGKRILATADSFTASTLNKVKTEVAKCEPLYKVYESIISIGLCKYVVDPLNGFWFSFGWIIFFETISVIFDIKLAKYLRRMKEPETLTSFDTGVFPGGWKQATVTPLHKGGDKQVLGNYRPISILPTPVLKAHRART